VVSIIASAWWPVLDVKPAHKTPVLGLERGLGQTAYLGAILREPALKPRGRGTAAQRHAKFQTTREIWPSGL